MKLKYKFVVRTVGGKKVAVAVGTDNEKFNGMIKLNDTGEFIFSMLNSGDFSETELVEKIMEKYDVDMENAKNSVASYIDVLNKNGLLE
ncbi:MAG: PqqD family protein [Ruminococcaceae bacterium]|nr:PqqD family protein [Oscillospiraceae bacterium]